MTGDAEEAAIKRLLVSRSGETVLLASREKLGTVAPFSIVEMGGIDTLIVEADLPEEAVAPFRRDGLTILWA
jgi:DeoR/GlpR family transcriptional regulator of sugar metabolism